MTDLNILSCNINMNGLNITILDKGCDTDGRITHIKTIVENINILFLSGLLKTLIVL